MIKRNLVNLTMVAGLIFGMTGCSLKDPFGIGYDTSSCEDSKNFGACGSPKNIYKHREQIRLVQKEYIMSGLEDELFFAVNGDGRMLVKADRDDKWMPYDTSPFKTEIDARNAKTQAIVDEKEGTGAFAPQGTGRLISPIANYQNDIPVTKETDLSVKYQVQGGLIQSRTTVGDIIRDNGMIQQVFVANYIDQAGDLVASHELYVVAKDPEWVVGEKTPKSVKLDKIPTPISTNLLNSGVKTNEYQEKVVDLFNSDQKEGVLAAIIDEPEKVDAESQADQELINSFLNSK